MEEKGFPEVRLVLKDGRQKVYLIDSDFHEEVTVSFHTNSSPTSTKFLPSVTVIFRKTSKGVFREFAMTGCPHEAEEILAKYFKKE